MAFTAQHLITLALNKIKVYAPGEPISGADLAQSFSTLNEMLDMWSNWTLACFAILEQSAPLVPGQASYTIGVGGQFNMARPLRLIEGPGAAYTIDPNGNKYGIKVVPRDRWNMIANTSNIVQANFP